MSPAATPAPPDLHLDVGRVLERLDALAARGATPGGGATRMALTPLDLAARDLVASWMEAARLDVGVDAIGNLIGVRAPDGVRVRR